MKFYKLFNSSGQTLLEALIALGALVVILTAVSVAVLTSLNNSTFVKQQNQANKLAQQGTELIRSQINSEGKFTIYAGYNGLTKCLNSENKLKDRYCDSSVDTKDLINGIFKREVTFASSDCDSGVGADFPDGLQIKMSVYWSSGKCPTSNVFCHKQEVTSCFINPAKVSVTAAQGI